MDEAVRRLMIVSRTDNHDRQAIGNELMSTQLTYLVAQQKVADFIRSAERARLAQSIRPSKSAFRRDGITRLVSRRLRSQESGAGAPAERGCAAPGFEPLLSRSVAAPVPSVRDRGGARAAADSELGHEERYVQRGGLLGREQLAAGDLAVCAADGE
jgi:hypothetical protein